MSLSALAPDTRSPAGTPQDGRAVGAAARLVPGPRPAPATADPLALLDAGLTVPVTSGGRVEYANFDYAASAPCAAVAAAAVNELLPVYASVHRGAGLPSQLCTDAYERARRSVARFAGCRPDDTVLFCRNTTDATNLLAHALPAGSTVVVFDSEHHATLLPWRRRGTTVQLPAPESPEAAERAVAAALRELRRDADPAAPILVAVTGASNVTGELWPVAGIARVAHRYGARVFLDAAQLAPHRPLDATELDVDYLAFSGHKLYAPFGAGVLAGRADWLQTAEPYLAGGGATARVGDATNDIDWNDGPARQEAGSPNLLGAVSLAAVCEALRAADRDALADRERALTRRLCDGLAGIRGVQLLHQFGPDADRVGIATFVVDGADSTELAERLSAEFGIGVRDGLFCAHPLTRRLLRDAAGTDAPRTAVRASLGLGSTPTQVDRLLTAVAAIASGAR